MYRLDHKQHILKKRTHFKLIPKVGSLKQRTFLCFTPFVSSTQLSQSRALVFRAKM